MRYSLRGWLMVGAVIAVVEAMSPPGETLSEGADRALERKWGRILVPYAVIQVGAHILNLIPPRYDLIHLGFQGIRAMLSDRKMGQ